MSISVTSKSSRQPFHEGAVLLAARELAVAQSGPSQLAFVFVSEDYLPHLEEFCDILRVDGRIMEVVGCTGLGLTDQEMEQEHGPGFSLLAVRAPGADFFVKELRGDGELEVEKDCFSGNPAPSSCLMLADPFTFPAEPWLRQFNARHANTEVLGGLASGSSEDSTVLFRNGRIIQGGATLIWWRGGKLGLRSVVSQGCRPIGEPLTVTRAENNIIYNLGAQPAYQALESAFQTLSDAEKSTARGNLFAGLATCEYVEDFLAGDFLIRNIIGADPHTGAVIIGGVPRIGQTLQYQFRDRTAASSDLADSLRRVTPSGTPLGSLLFRCTARSQAFFGTPNHDTLQLQSTLGEHPSAGFLCHGEIGPLHGVTCLTAYTASIGLFYEENAT
jgi:small ligand-binding sensory domain FIST